MSTSLILYGSRARGEAEPNSDVDLILAGPGPGLRRPHVSHGVSVHWYSQEWLVEGALTGNLFVYHVAFEGVPLLDPESFLVKLRESFVQKGSYRKEANEAAMVLKLTMTQSWIHAGAVRRRFFWALRTLLIAEAADKGRPVFSAASLEGVVGLFGIERLIKSRAEADQNTCSKIGCAVLEACDVQDLSNLSDQQLRSVMLQRGGMAADTVKLIEEGEMIEASVNATYV